MGPGPPGLLGLGLGLDPWQDLRAPLRLGGGIFGAEWARGLGRSLCFSVEKGRAGVGLL